MSWMSGLNRHPAKVLGAEASQGFESLTHRQLLKNTRGHNMDIHEEESFEPVFEKPSRGDRINRSESARQRRKETKEFKEFHSYKEEKESRERLKAKRRLEKQKKRSLTSRVKSANI